MSKAAPSTSYQLSKFEDQETEVQRLRLQAAMSFAQEDAVLRKLGFPEHGKVLEVGCGPGLIAHAVCASRPDLEVFGIDIDHKSLLMARENLPVLQASAYALPFASNTFDAVYCRLVLRHVQDPERAISELVRVTRSGGTVFTIDSDDGQMVLDPMPELFAEVQHARLTTARRRGGEPFRARKLAGLFHRSGLSDTRVDGLAISSAMIGRGNFTRVLLLPVVDLIDPDLIEEEAIERCARSIRAWSEDEAAFGMVVATFVAGRKQGTT